MNNATILIVEDDPVNEFVIKKMLEKHYKLVFADTSKKAINIVSKYSIDLILMDINLGGDKIDGVALMHDLKSNYKLDTKPFFAVTSYAMPGDKEKYLNKGFSEYIAKPLDQRTLFELINKHTCE